VRFGLFDLVLFIALFTLGALLTLWLLPRPVSLVLLAVSVVASLVLAVIVSSWVYRRFRLSPFLLPRCPHCRDLNRHYWTESGPWPMESIVCDNCQVRIELCHDNTKCQWSDLDLPRFQLLWPYSIGGRWQPVACSDPAKSSSNLPDTCATAAPSNPPPGG